MMKRRGFFGKLAGLLGLAALPSRGKACSCDPFANLDMMGCAISEGPPINLAELLPFPPGTIKQCQVVDVPGNNLMAAYRCPWCQAKSEHAQAGVLVVCQRCSVKFMTIDWRATRLMGTEKTDQNIRSVDWPS